MGLKTASRGDLRPRNFGTRPALHLGMTLPSQAPSARSPQHGTAILFAASALIMSGFTGGSCGPIDPPSPLPPAPIAACDQLEEQSCNARGDCTAVYEQACACPACDPEFGECFPCDCVEPGFVSCHPNDPCAGLSELACDRDAACSPTYVVPPCPEVACPPGANCLPPECPDVPEYYECSPTPPPPPVCPAIGCRLYCEAGMVIGPDGCETCECNEPPPPPVCDGVVCTLYCEYGFATGPDGCEICVCNEPPPPPPMCEPVLCEIYCEYGFVVDESGCEICQCNERPTDPGCRDDADCPGGYCEHFATCAGLDCPPPPPSVCIDVNCDDGSLLICDAIEPRCPPGEVVAVRNGCYQCLDARSCR